MLSPVDPRAPKRLMDRFRSFPGYSSTTGFLPTLRAYGGLMVVDEAEQRIGQTLGHLGSMEVRLACKAAEVRGAQKLRYRVFYQEGSAIADAAKMMARRDVDAYDAICDHLLVIDHALPTARLRRSPAVVGTYRLLRQDIADRHGGFYSAGEFDIDGLIDDHRNLKFLELGRSCVLPPYRNKRTVELLWRGIWTYVRRHRLDVMIGCASLKGTNPDQLALPLSFLHHYARAPEPWRGRARPERYAEMNRMSKEAIDAKQALRVLPPLIRGYLRLGAVVGDGAVVDYQFGTTDVLIVLPVSGINTRYFAHFGAPEERHAA
ncbi:MAG: GNAT family N-acetyltransferase [Rhizobiales bacterium]|nr:GNAT family N-acetyltransferase [Hyphomicrobiales bacterium]